MPLEIRAHKLGATLRVAARPGAGKNAVLGEHGGALKVALAAPPEKGKANKELIRYLAGLCGTSRADLELLSGESSRDKVVLVRSLGAEELLARLGGLVGK